MTAPDLSDLPGAAGSLGEQLTTNIPSTNTPRPFRQSPVVGIPPARDTEDSLYKFILMAPSPFRTEIDLGFIFICLIIKIKDNFRVELRDPNCRRSWNPASEMERLQVITNKGMLL